MSGLLKREALYNTTYYARIIYFYVKVEMLDVSIFHDALNDKYTLYANNH